MTDCLIAVVFLRASPVSVSQRVFVIERAVIRNVLAFMSVSGPRAGLSPSVALSLSPARVSLEVSEVN